MLFNEKTGVPYTAASLFGISAHELTDTCLDLNLLPDTIDKHLSNRLLDAETAKEQIGIISIFLFELANKKQIHKTILDSPLTIKT